MMSKSGSRFLALLATVTVATYDETIALEHAWLATAAMCSPGASAQSVASLEAWQCGPPCDAVKGMTNVRAVQSGKANDAFAYVGILNDVCVAVYRGTSNVAGWIADLKSANSVDLEASLVPCNVNGVTCQVGDGFMDNYASLADFVKGNLSDIGCTKGSKLRITGHSLGAAEAAIAMFDLKNEGYDLVEQYTFGQPRVGDATFAAAFAREFASIDTYRVTHASDPVPHLPLELMNFKHIATEVYYKDTTDDGYVICNGSGEDSSCANSRSADLLFAIAKCADSGDKCAHLDYMTTLKTGLMDGSECTETAFQAVQV